MENKYLISVIIPVYNTEKFLVKCLDSVINQTFKDLEIICINDGSPDNSLQILEEYKKKDERIKIIDQNNQGVSVARNNGIENANGEYIFFLDSDDYIDKNFFEIFYKNAKTNNSDLVILNSFWNLKDRVTKNYHSALPTWAMFIRRKVLIDNNFIRYPLNIQPGEDGLFSHVLLTYCEKITHDDNVIYYYIKHETQSHNKLTKSPSIIITDIKKYFEYLNNFYNKNNLYQTKSLSFLKYIEQECFLFFRTKAFNKDDEMEVFSIIKNEVNNLITYIKNDDYKYFSSEFNIFINSKTIKDYYKQIKYRYNYIRFQIFGKTVSIRYKENRYKIYK